MFDGPTNAITLAVEGALALASAVAGVSAIAVLVPLSLWIWNESYITSLRIQRYKGPSVKSCSVAPGTAGYMEPRKTWQAEELTAFDGSRSPDGPILIAVDGLVFNVARARDLYAPGGEYCTFAGKDASRYLARNSVEDETTEQVQAPLTVAERAALAVWLFSFNRKYDVVGRLLSAEEAQRVVEADAREEEYWAKMEELSESVDADGAMNLSAQPLPQPLAHCSHEPEDQEHQTCEGKYY